MSERKPWREPVQIRPLSERNVLHGTALNLSEGGALVELARPPKETSSIVILAIDVGGVETRLQALVQRHSDVRGKARLGLTFIYLGEHDRHALRLHLRAAKSRS